MNGICSRCGVKAKIVKSHAIPNSFFRKLLRKEGRGQYVDLTAGQEKNRSNQDSGWSPLLCEACERWFNVNFDMPIDRMIDRYYKQSLRHRSICHLQGSTNALAGFITAVLWRAAVSKNRRYDSMSLGSNVEGFLHGLLLEDETDFFRRGSFYLRRLTVGVTNLPRDTFDDVIMAPGVDGSYSGKGVCWKFAGRGFVFGAVFPKLAQSEQRKLGCFGRNKAACSARSLYVLDDPDFTRIIKAGLSKDRLGHSTLRD